MARTFQVLGSLPVNEDSKMRALCISILILRADYEYYPE